MSKFFQRYQQNLKVSEKKYGESTSVNVKNVVDPTSMIGGDGKSGGRLNKVRRVQIMNKSDDFNPNASFAKYDKSEESESFLKDTLHVHYLFANLSNDDLGKIIACMRPIEAIPGEYIIRQGETGDLFYCLESGKCKATVETIGDVMEYGRGGSFGELALIYNSPRAASVIASEDCRLFALELSVFRSVLANTNSNNSVNLCEFLKKCPFLDTLSNEQIAKLSGALDSSTYEDGEFIVRQGGAGTDFFIIEEGTVKCTQTKASGREVELINLKAGDYFGEMALLLNELRAANCIAVGPVKCLSLDREKFDMLLGSAQDILSRRMRIRVLQCVPLLSKLPEAKLVKLCGVMRAQTFQDGTYIIKQGDEGSRFYIINEGEVKCTRNKGTNGEEDELIRLNTQEFFGERALITNETRKANVIAVGSVECLVLERDVFQSLLNEIQEDIENTMSRREREEGEAKEREEALAKAAEEDSAKRGPLTTFKIEELRIMRTIGTGSFGRVKMVQSIVTGQVFALKYMNKAEVIANHQAQNILAEKRLLYECSESNFVLKLMQTFQSPTQVMMLMEFVQGGELWSLIYERGAAIPRNPFGGFELSSVRFYAASCVLAFKHIHNRNIAYRDMKPENILIDSKGYLKIIDFGFAKKFPFMKNGSSQNKTYTLCGTPEYLAPEIIMSKGYDKACDYWALGCMIYELYLARTPYAADFANKIFQNIIGSPKTLSFEKKQDSAHASLCKKLLTSNPAFRLGNLIGGCDDIMKDSFFENFDWKALDDRKIPAPYTPPVKNALDAANFDKYDENVETPDYYGDQAPFEDF
jgi:CRP-like cAMP-binding protein